MPFVKVIDRWRASNQESVSMAWRHHALHKDHYSDVIMGTVVSQITSLTNVYSTVYLGVDQRKHQSSASLAFVRGIHRWPVNSPHKGPVTRNFFSFDDVIICSKPYRNISWKLETMRSGFRGFVSLAIENNVIHSCELSKYELSWLSESESNNWKFEVRQKWPAFRRTSSNICTSKHLCFICSQRLVGCLVEWLCGTLPR